MAQEKVITTRFIDGNPDGIRACTSPLSPITTVFMPRSLLARAKQLGLPKRGIYYLLKSGGAGIKKAYVGQTVKGIQRLNDHNSKKSWWNVAVLFLSNDAHTFTLDVVTGLEKHAIEMATSALGSIVENKVDPQYVIQAHDKPTVDSLYGEIEFMMKALGYALDASTGSTAAQAGMTSTAPKKQPTPAQSQLSLSGMDVSMTRRGITVTGTYSGGAKGTLTLHKGSPIDMAATIYAKDKGTPIKRQQLLGQGKLIVQSGSNIAILQEDVVFNSPTAAAQFVYGGAIDGRRDFKDASGQSIKAVCG
ncbi:MAG: GIY-YIG nuclease family protein [Acidobacteriota bacterium]|nr:GIY-YIG nuclease family protein [Acidobacteriota bacterium]